MIITPERSWKGISPWHECNRSETAIFPHHVTTEVLCFFVVRDDGVNWPLESRCEQEGCVLSAQVFGPSAMKISAVRLFLQNHRWSRLLNTKSRDWCWVGWNSKTSMGHFLCCLTRCHMPSFFLSNLPTGGEWTPFEDVATEEVGTPSDQKK